MTAQPRQYVSLDEYLAYERTSTTKHEYLAGVMYAMAGGSARHNRIAGNAYAALHAQLRKRNCTICQSDMRVKIVQTGLYTYPDIAVVCGNEQFEDSREDTLLNPTVIIEVLSPSTEKYDRGKKFHNYRSVLSLREYILIAQDEYHIERFVRQMDNSWVLSEAIALGDHLELTTIQCTLHLDDVYEKVPLAVEDETDSVS